MVLKKEAKKKLLEKISSKDKNIMEPIIKDVGKDITEFLVKNDVSWEPELSPEQRNKEALFLEIPEDVRFKKGELWCPYCGKTVKFKADGWGHKACILCGVSDNMFYVKKVNRLWK